MKNPLALLTLCLALAAPVALHAYPAVLFNPTNGMIVVPTNINFGTAIVPSFVTTNQPESVAIEAFGGVGDCKYNYTTLAASGSPLIVATNALFTAADVGKSFQLMQDTTNLTAIAGQIISVQSPTNATLSRTSGASGMFTFKWGTDNTLPVVNAVSNLVQLGGGAVTFRKGGYVFNSPLKQIVTGKTYWTMINLPGHALRSSSTNVTVSVDFIGAGTPMRSLSATSNGPAMTGTIFEIFTEPTNNTSWQTFISQSGITDYPLEQFHFQSITFRQHLNPRLWALWFDSGGSVGINECAFDVEYYPGFAGQAVYPFQPTNNYLDPFAGGSIWTPGTANNSGINLKDIFVFGYGGGITLGEHAVVSGGLEVQNCGTALGLNLSSTTIPAYVQKAHLLACYQPIYCLPGPNVFACSLDIRMDLEPHGPMSPMTILAPSNTVSGDLFVANNPYLGTNYLGLTVHDQNSGQQYSPNLVASKLASELGSSPLSSGLIFDLPFIPDLKAGTTTYFYDRALGARCQGNGGSFTILPTGGFEGNNLLFTDGSSVGQSGLGHIIIPTNTFAGLTSRVTVDMLIRQPDSSRGITYPFLPASGNQALAFWYGAGAQVAFRTRTPAGQVNATANVTLGLEDGNWHQITGTYDGTNNVLWIDGLPVGSAAQSGNLYPFTDNILLGGDWNDQMSHFRVWNRVLSTNEIYSLAASRRLTPSIIGKGFVAPQPNVTNWTYNLVPALVAGQTNWIGPVAFTNGCLYCIATNPAGGYWFQNVTKLTAVSTAP